MAKLPPKPKPEPTLHTYDELQLRDECALRMLAVYETFDNPEQQPHAVWVQRSADLAWTAAEAFIAARRRQHLIDAMLLADLQSESK
jgi:hypothetical protein